MPIPQWTLFETGLNSITDYKDPFWEITVQVEFIAPSGRRLTVDAFWNGGSNWVVRFSADEKGEWQWQSICSNTADIGLYAQQGRFKCVSYTGSNLLYQHGALTLSHNRHYFTHADGSLFFWMGDTAWNGVLHAKENDWEHYLQTRREQQFTVIQFVSTQWRGCSQDPYKELGFSGTDQIHFNLHFFQRLDSKVAAINLHGLIAAPVLLWALRDTDPGQILSEKSAIQLARYLVARWGAYQVVWMLGGDGNYAGNHSERWKRIGRAVFGDRHDRLVTMHPFGWSWVGDVFRNETWFDFISYQSCHGDTNDQVKWLVQGPPATEWDQEPVLPVVNLEPNYEKHPVFGEENRRFTDFEVRRAAYWSMLINPPAGLTYGINAIWVWLEQSGPAEGHERIGLVEPWYTGLDTLGVRSMTLLRQFFDTLPWEQLWPAQELLLAQPGNDDPHRFIAAAKTKDNMHVVVYVPTGENIQLDMTVLQSPVRAQWFNPREGRWIMIDSKWGSQPVFNPPDRQDWVLCIRKARSAFLAQSLETLIPHDTQLNEGKQ